MVDLVGLGTLAGGLAQLGGAFFGGGNQNRRLNQNLGYQALSSERQTQALQRRAYYQGVQDRVADAKAAGLHPLFALGYQAPAYSPRSAYSAEGVSYDDSWEQAGRGLANIGRGASRMSGNRRALDEANLRRINAAAEADEAQAAYWQSEAAKNNQTAPVVVPDANAPVEAPPQVKKGKMTSPITGDQWKHGPSFAERAEALYDELGAMIWGAGGLVRDMAMYPENFPHRLNRYGGRLGPMDRKLLRKLITPPRMRKYNTRKHWMKHANPVW